MPARTLLATGTGVMGEDIILLTARWSHGRQLESRIGAGLLRGGLVRGGPIRTGIGIPGLVTCAGAGHGSVGHGRWLLGSGLARSRQS